MLNEVKSALCGKKLLGCMMLFILVSCLYAGDPGTTSGNFLKIGAGARNVGMGEAATAVVNDVNSVYWNPAGLNHVKTYEATFMYNSWFQDVNQQFIGYVYPYFNDIGIFGLSIYRLGMKEFQGYDANGVKTENVTAGDLAVGVSYARRFSSSMEDNVYNTGITLKTVNEKLDDASASAFAADLGLQYSGFPFLGEWSKDLTYGLVISNIGTKLKFDSEGFSLPMTVKTGFGYTKEVMGEPLTGAVDVFLPNDNDVSVGFGIEYLMKDLLALRVGYKTGDSEGSGIRAGAGIKMKGINLDYAFVGYGDLGDTHRIGVTVKFGEEAAVSVTGRRRVSVSKSMELGRKMYDDGRYKEAILEFNKVLEKDPGNKEAFEMMKKANDKLKEIK